MTFAGFFHGIVWFYAALTAVCAVSGLYRRWRRSRRFRYVPERKE